MKLCVPVLLVLLTLAGIPSVSGADAQPGLARTLGKMG
jgi:hypothetical protein